MEGGKKERKKVSGCVSLQKRMEKAEGERNLEESSSVPVFGRADVVLLLLLLYRTSK